MIIVLGTLIIGLFPFFLFYLIKKYQKNKYRFCTYFFTGTILSVLLFSGLAYWSELDTKIRLKNFNGVVYNSDFEEFQINYENIAPENLKEVKAVESSMMGIGWPLKAILFSFIYIFYLLIVYIILQLLQKFNKMFF